MGVYIKNAKMPMNCAGCPRNEFFATTSEYRCLEIPRPIRSLYLSNPIRPEWCPLQEIKEPHGRLGDLDELRDRVETSRVRNVHEDYKIRRNHDVEHKHFLHMIANTLDALPAEGSD